MNLIRKAHRNSLWLWLLAITVGVRALIAPGFMLETTGDGPFGLAIVFCEGLNGASGTSDDPHALHGKHHGNTGADEDATTGLTNASCGLWSTSSTLVEALAFSAEHLYPSGPDQFGLVSDSVVFTLFRQQPQQPRAPPVSLII